MTTNQEEQGPGAQILDSLEEQNRAYSIGAHQEHTFYFIHVRKGKGEAELEIENPVYTARLDRTKGTRLGLKFDPQVATHSLFIKEVVGGLAFTWNSTHHDQKVRPGDRIIRVNQTEGDPHAMMEECKKCQVLDLELRRGTAVPITPGLSVTVKKSFGNFEPDERGTVTKVDDEGDALMKIQGVGNQWVCKQDYDKFTFEDSERFYLKRYCDFRELYMTLKGKVDAGTSAVIKTLPDVPEEERFGFRRSLSGLGMSSFMAVRREGLQKYLDVVMSQVKKFEDEPALNDFFGNDSVPEVSTARKDVLKQRLEQLIQKHRSLEQHKNNN